MELMHDDLPAPVAPAMSTWGSSERLSIFARPEMSTPRPTARGWLAAAASGLRRTSPRVIKSSLAVGYFDPDGGFARNRDQQPDIGSGQGVGDVVGQARNPVDLDAGSELDLVAGDSGARHDLGQLGIDAVLAQRLLQLGGRVFQCLAALLLATPGPRRSSGGQLIAARGGRDHLRTGLALGLGAVLRWR